MIDFKDIVEPEWLDWYNKTPAQRYRESQSLFEHYLRMGGSLDPDIDSESPFWSRSDLDAFSRSIVESRQQAGVVVVEAPSVHL